MSVLAFNIFIYTNKGLYRQAPHVTMTADVCEYSYTGSHWLITIPKEEACLFM